MNGIKEIISADEQLYEDDMNDKQSVWLKEFIDVYFKAQDLEYFIEKNKE